MMLEITKADVLARLHFDNPWWDKKNKHPVPFHLTPRRKYFEAFLAAVGERSVRRSLVLMGPRRVGKTVMVFHAIHALLTQKTSPSHILYLSLETPIYTGLSLEALLKYFFELGKHPKDAPLFVFFDEVQYLKNWEVHLKSLVDSFPQVKFIATGSAAAALRLKSNESGAGRFTDFILPPLSFAEFLHLTGKEKKLIKRSKNTLSYHDIHALNDEFINYLNYGGYPEAVFSERIRDNPGQYIRSDIIDKVLLRDLPSLYGISDIQELNRLFTTLAFNTGNEVSLEGLTKSSGVAKNTVKRYLEYLEAAFLIRRIERVDQNAKRFQRANFFKVYLNNPSMRSALFGSIEPNAQAMGALTETAIFSQWAHADINRLFYARWKTGEVDIVCLSDHEQKPTWIVEVKWSDAPAKSKQLLSHCVEFCQANPSISRPITVTSRTEHMPNFVYKNTAFELIPASWYAYLLGSNFVGASANIYAKKNLLNFNKRMKSDHFIGIHHFQ